MEHLYRLKLSAKLRALRAAESCAYHFFEEDQSVQDLILTLHVVVCVSLVILILLQAGKEGMGVIFGGGNASVFGSSGAGGVLVKLTTLMAVLFVITSLSYNKITSSRAPTDSVILDVQFEENKAPAPVTNSTK